MYKRSVYESNCKLYRLAWKLACMLRINCVYIYVCVYIYIYTTIKMQV